jgi:predicted AAA+ superfamily ATPase
LEWKGRRHKCLVISGQRQVGKTFIVREFGKEYENFIEVNLNDDREAAKAFDGDLTADEIVKRMMLYYGRERFVPGKALIFSDEVRECPEAYSSLKTFTIDGGYDVIASGSLPGVN